MKYIRMENGILTASDFNDKVDQYSEHGVDWTPLVIKRADTIKELLDGFIVLEKSNDDNWFVLKVDELPDKEELKYLSDTWDFLGYIKTKRGLIYVAKLNQEGDTVLL